MIWLVLCIILISALAIDLFLHRDHHAISIKDAFFWSFTWISLALLFNVYVYFVRGTEDALIFLTGYLVEKSLSVDNLFVFLVIFKYFQTPPASQHKVLFWGVVVAVAIRLAFIFAGIALINQFHWIIYIFGLILIYSGIKIGIEKEKEVHPEKNPVIRLFCYLFPMTTEYHDSRFFIEQAGRYLATPLFIVLLAIETTDILFAVDSIPAILAITRDPFLVLSSNIFAILGLRSLFFVLSHIMGLFHYLRIGLAIILCFIGVKMVLADIYDVPIGVALSVIFVTLVLSVLASVLFPVNNKR